MLSRRSLLLAGGASVIALSGCSAITALTTSQLDADLGTLSSGLAAVANFLSGLGVNIIPANVVQEAQNVIAGIQAQSANIVATIAPNQQLLTAISEGVTTLAAILTPFFPAAGGIAVAIQAALSLIGVILQEANVTVPTTKALPKIAPMAAADARSYLKSIAANGLK